MQSINYALSMAANLAAPNWTALATHSATQGMFTYTDTGAINPSRFYGAVNQQGGERNTVSEVPKKTATTTQRSL
jgi:hypothetical protein